MTQFDLFGSAIAQAAADTAGPPDAVGWVTVTIPIEAIDQAASDLIRLGSGAEVLEPPELRRRIAETARGLSHRYGEE